MKKNINDFSCYPIPIIVYIQLNNGFEQRFVISWHRRVATDNIIIFRNDYCIISDNRVINIIEITRGIKEFTISSAFSSLIETLAEFEKNGIYMNGLTTVNARYTDWETGEHSRIPAIKMEVR